jgi:hypothetical protein
MAPNTLQVAGWDPSCEVKSGARRAVPRGRTRSSRPGGGCAGSGTRRRTGEDIEAAVVRAIEEGAQWDEHPR